MEILDFLNQTSYASNSLMSWNYFFILLIMTLLLAKPIANSLFKLLELAASKTESSLDDQVIALMRPPLHFIIRIIGLYLAFHFLQLPQTLTEIIAHFFNSLILFSFFWILYRAVELVMQSMQHVGKKLGKTLHNDILNFFSKGLRVFIVLIGAMSMLQEWGFNVSGFVASLGLGGLAFALAAKDTAANLFGSLVIFSDKPFKVGDWIQTPLVEGTIESVGIRSTRVRTFSQAQVTVPNAELANAAIINWSRMEKRRIKTTLGLTYNTSPDQIKQILKDLKAYLRNHDDIDQNTIFIQFSGFGASTLDIFFYFFTKTTSWGEYMDVKEAVLLDFMHIIKDKNGSDFAFPTQTLHLEKQMQ